MPHSPITRTEGGSVSTIKTFLLGGVFDGSKRKGIGRNSIQGGNLNKQNCDNKSITRNSSIKNISNKLKNNINNNDLNGEVNRNPHVWSPVNIEDRNQLNYRCSSLYSSTPNLSNDESFPSVKSRIESYATLGRPSVKKMVQKIESIKETIGASPPSLNSSSICLSSSTTDTGFQSDLNVLDHDFLSKSFAELDSAHCKNEKNKSLPVRANSFHQSNPMYESLPPKDNCLKFSFKRQRKEVFKKVQSSVDKKDIPATKRKRSFAEKTSSVHYISDGCCEIKSLDLGNKLPQNSCVFEPVPNPYLNQDSREFFCSTPKENRVESSKTSKENCTFVSEKGDNRCIIEKENNKIVCENEENFENKETQETECKIIIGTNGSFLARWVPVEDL